MNGTAVRETVPGRWMLEEWREWRDERATILEYDAGLSRADAEAQADELVTRLRRLQSEPAQSEMFSSRKEI